MRIKFLAYGVCFALGAYISPVEPEPAPRPKIFPVPQAITIYAKEDGQFEARIYLKNRGNLPAVSTEVLCQLFREKTRLLTHTTTAGILLPREKVAVFCPLGRLKHGKFRLKVSVTYDGRYSSVVKWFRLPGANIRAVHPHMEIRPLAPYPDKPFSIRIGYVNNGDIVSEPTPIALNIFQGEEKVYGPDMRILSPLEPDEEYALLYDVPGLPAGKFRIVIQIDPEGRITEKYEKDNVFEKSLHIKRKMLSFPLNQIEEGEKMWRNL